MDALGSDDIELVISVILASIQEHMQGGDRVELRGFGSFYTTYRKPRLARNPRTGLPIEIPGKWVPHFKAGKKMRVGVNSTFTAKLRAPSRLRRTDAQRGVGAVTKSVQTSAFAYE